MKDRICNGHFFCAVSILWCKQENKLSGSHFTRDYHLNMYRGISILGATDKFGGVNEKMAANFEF